MTTLESDITGAYTCAVFLEAETLSRAQTPPISPAAFSGPPRHPPKQGELFKPTAPEGPPYSGDVGLVIKWPMVSEYALMEL